MSMLCPSGKRSASRTSRKRQSGICMPRGGKGTTQGRHALHLVLQRDLRAQRARWLLIPRNCNSLLHALGIALARIFPIVVNEPQASRCFVLAVLSAQQLAEALIGLQDCCEAIAKSPNQDLWRQGSLMEGAVFQFCKRPILRAHVPSVVPLQGREEDDTSPIKRKSGRRMRRHEGSSHHRGRGRFFRPLFVKNHDEQAQKSL